MGDISTSSPGPIGIDSTPHQVIEDECGPQVEDGDRTVPDPQLQALSPGSHISTQHAFSSQLDMTSPPPAGVRQGPYHMAPLVNALPTPNSLPLTNFQPGQYHQGAQHRYNPTSSSPMVHQMHQLPQYTGQVHPLSMTQNQGYYVQQPHMGPYYAAGPLSSTQMQSAMSPRPNMAYYSGTMAINHQQSGYFYTDVSPYTVQPQNIPGSVDFGHYNIGRHSLPKYFVTRQPSTTAGVLAEKLKGTSHEKQKGAVRGPPRKPRQNGHAIWMGNLPPHTDLMSLVHHVCRETEGLESLFLISKSNCAFANFKDEKSCSIAQQKLHESKFQSVRLVSRLRKSTVDATAIHAAPIDLAASDSGNPVMDSMPLAKSSATAEVLSPVSSQSGHSRSHTSEERFFQGDTLPRDRFFILKSLTLEDLELSVRTGLWATQSHNEEILNDAFKTCDNVILVFSANKSGEYFGYARMCSEVNSDPGAAIEFAPASQAQSDPDRPKAIPTDATEYAPKGRIIDDSARGTIFWEVERDSSELESDDETEVAIDKDTSGPEEEIKTWGKPFNLEWLSTNPLPFYRTRGLRNPWNSNREVKIARDGTELEPSIGQKLIGLFNRVQSPVSVGNAHSQGLMMPRYQQMRPYRQ